MSGSRLQRPVRAQGLTVRWIADPRHSPSHSAAPWLLLLLAPATGWPGRALTRPQQPLAVIRQSARLPETAEDCSGDRRRGAGPR